MSEEIIDTYSTKVEAQQELDIPYEGSGFEDVVDETGVIPTTLNVPVMVQRMAKDIYKNATSGIRELYMNAVRGCEDGVELFGYKDPHITVTINEGERIIIIEDNGRGITKARFKQVLRELGTSDNFDGHTTGQFGMGFASYTTLASVVVLDTIGDNGDNYKMLCRDGTSSKYGGKSDLEGHGVKLTLTCYSNVDFDAVCDKLYNTARHAKVPTTVVIEEFEYEPDNFREGTNEIEQVSFDDDVSAGVEETGVIRINHEDFTLLASDSVEHKRNVSLLNVPIDSEIEVPFNWWVLNIKDERKYQPMPDRDRMREESDKALQSVINNAITDYFKDIGITNYNEYINSPRRHEYLWLIQHREYASVATQDILSRLDSASSLKKVDYKDKKGYTHSLLYWLREAGEAGITYQGYKNKQYTDKVKPYIGEKCILLIAKKSKNESWKESVATLEAFGVPMVKQILIDNKVKLPKRVAGVGDKIIVGHEHSRYYETTDYTLEDVNETFVRVDSMKMSKLISFAREFPTDLTFMRNDPSLKDTECLVFSEWIQNFKTVEVLTNKGPMTADTLAQNPEVTYCADLEPEMNEIVQGQEATIIMDTSKTLGVVLLKYLEYNTTKTEWPYNLMNRCYLDTLFEEKYGIKMYSDDAKKFFCSHLSEIDNSYQELFARLILHCNDNFADEIAETQMLKYLADIKEYGQFEEDNEIDRLKFYHNKWLNLPNKNAGITKIFDNLVDKCKKKIQENDYLITSFVQVEMIPKLFGEVEMRQCQKVDTGYYSNCEFKVAFTTKLRSLNFDESLKAYGFNAKFTNMNIRIYNKHTLVTADMEITD